MIVCPNCNHQNPDGARACEACYTPLPVTASCPNCGATVQADAAFCGQCGFNLGPSSSSSEGEAAVRTAAIPPTVVSQPGPDLAPPPPVVPEPIATVAVGPNLTKSSEISQTVSPGEPPATVPAASQPVATGAARTQLQQQSVRLVHIQTNTSVELPTNLSLVHLGKPNDLVPPDIDVSGFPHSEVVSRFHADIRVEGDAYYIEDVGSSNGTYINNTPLPRGNRHRLRPGDRISLGKGDLVSFLFQVS